MASLNRVTIIGNLGADPEVRRSQSGDPIVSFRVACTESWKDKTTGERKERTEWVPVVIFNEGLAGVAEQYLRKGSKVCVEGAFQTRKWKDQTGADRYSTEVVLQRMRGTLVLLDGKGGGEIRDEPRAAKAAAASASSGGHLPLDSMEDEIPFAMEWR